ncbi:MAG TPA: homoserine dehydrogenase [Bacillota bacterium]
MRAVGIGLLGCGNVGAAFWGLAERIRTYTAMRDGRTFDVRRVLVRDREKPRPQHVRYDRLTEDAYDVLADPEIEIVVEAMGGFEPARSYLLEALRRGKHVVTANKVVMAKAWAELWAAAEQSGAALRFEAAVGAALPVVESLRGSLSAAPVLSVRGIVNGTSNYILTRMGEGLEFAEALAEAQRLGYAEPDPADDIDGHDAAYKIAILAALAFGWNIDMSEVKVEGIRGITQADVIAARKAGREIKLVAQAEQLPDGELDLQVGPVELPNSDPLANVRGVENAVVVEGDPLGTVTFRGPGAGPGPTAAALMGDVRRIELGGDARIVRTGSPAWRAATRETMLRVSSDAD